MTTSLLHCFGLLLLAISFAPVRADDSAGKEIALLVKQLGSSDFRTRVAATARLKKVGEPALDALQNSAKTGDLETRRRIEDIVFAIEKKLYVELQRLTGHTDKVRCVSASVDCKRLLTSSDDKTIRLWDVETGKELQVFKGHTDCILGAALSTNGKQVLSGSHDGTVRLWDANTGKQLRIMSGHSQGVLSVAFGPEGYALSTSFDGTLRIWDLSTGKNACILSGHRTWVPSVAYHQRSKFAATCSMDTDRSIRLWNIETRKQIRQWDTQSRNTTKVSFSPDGKRLVSAGLDGAVYVWDVASGKKLLRIQPPPSEKKNPDIYCVDYSPDGKRIVTGGTDTTVRVWDVATGIELRKYEGHAASIFGVTLFPDGKRIASASEDCTVRIWRAPR